VSSSLVAEPMAGTAVFATAWLCIEQPGPWGHDALADSHLDPVLAHELAARAKAAGVRVSLIRQPGRHADTHQLEPRRVFVAHTRPGTSWLERATIADPKQLLDLDLHAIAAGEEPGLGVRTDDPLLMVCTNGRRDVCCALWGRQLVGELADGETVWECSHTGGHRFAPTGVLLPTGYCYGRMDAALGRRLLSTTHVVTDACRGRSTWEQAGQVAELAVRETTGDHDPDSLFVGAVRDHRVPVSHIDGRHWTVTLAEVTGSVARVPKCGAEPVPPVSIEVVSVRQS
jgi:hypothetical protein